jgi:hypothetical protein
MVRAEARGEGGLWDAAYARWYRCCAKASFGVPTMRMTRERGAVGTFS